MRRTAAAPLLLALSVLAAPAAAAGGEFPLAPYQMVRSLALVQDRIAGGDSAALPMQRKLLTMIDTRLSAAPAADFADERNFNALLVYGMSGGNPATVATVVSRLDLEEPRAALGAAILAYVRGRPHETGKALDGVDPLAQPPELGAFLALVKGSVASAEDPAAAVRLLDEARLLGPGTLVEEAALRRTVILAIKLKDAGRFMQASAQYVRRFLGSPYASQFADSFVDGVAAFHGETGLGPIADVVAQMNLEQQKAIYLRLARKSAVDGNPALAAFAADRVQAAQKAHSPGTDQRALLYASIASITSGTVDAAAIQLKAIDRSQLTERDRRLLDAAAAVAASVTARPDAPAATPEPRDERMRTRKAADAAPEAAEADRSAELVDETRRRLAAVDKMLEETGR